MVEWQDIATAPEERVVWTKIHDAGGARNVQRLRRSGRLWFDQRTHTYVYYTPTHWADNAPSPPESGQ